MEGLRELLLFYRDAGVDAALDEHPADRFVSPAPAAAPRVAKPAPEPAPAAAAPLLAVPDDGQAARARGLAASAATLDELRRIMESFDGCNLKFTASRLVFGDGNPEAPLMVIGEAPGADEDRQGEPFVGRAGKLLDQMLRAMGWPREQVYIGNLLKCRPPNNRDPQLDEVAACEPYLHRQIELVRPDLLLVLGRVAAQNLLKTELPIGKLRGQVHRYGPLQTPLVVTYHPAYLLRSPREKARAWADLKRARALLADGAARTGS